MSKEAFREAVFDWVREATSGDLNAMTELTRRHVWRKQADGSFHGGEVVEARWNNPFYDRTSAIQSWQRLSSEAAGWPALAQHLAENCGCTLSTGAIFADLGLLTRPFLPDPVYLEDCRYVVVPFTRDRCEALFDRFCAFIESDESRFRYVTIVAGLLVPDGVLPFDLGHGVVLENLSPEMLNLFASFGMIRSHVFMGQPGPFEVPGRPWLALRWLRSFPKVTRETIAQDAATAGNQKRAETESIREAFAAALALMRFGGAFLGTTAHIQDDWNIGGYSSTIVSRIPDTDPIRNSTALEAGDLDEVKVLFSHLLERKGHRGAKVAIAIRRLILATADQLDEDRLLDGMIAAEALLGEFTEIRYKMAIRCAFLLEPLDERKRRIVFDDMQNAYAVRSRIVHGSQPDPSDVKLAGEKVAFPEFVRGIEDHIRKAVKTIVLDGEAPDWNAMIIGEKE